MDLDARTIPQLLTRVAPAKRFVGLVTSGDESRREFEYSVNYPLNAYWLLAVIGVPRSATMAKIDKTITFAKAAAASSHPATMSGGTAPDAFRRPRRGGWGDLFEVEEVPTREHSTNSAYRRRVSP